jgi:hypothetical protein
MRTSATDVSIHAVSPELPVHFSRTVAEQLGGAAGAAGAAAAGAGGRVVLRDRGRRGEADENGRSQRWSEAGQ